MLARSTGGATVAAGGDSWFLITPNYAFGHQLDLNVSTTVQNAQVGAVRGRSVYPFPETTDFSTYLLQAPRAAPGCSA